MNKAYEKIIEKLEEKLKKSEERYHRYLDDSNLSCMFDKSDIEETRVDTIKEMLKIVQEVSEEYISTDTSNNDWIPIKTRPMSEEEKEYYSEYLFEDNGLIYECPLPDDGQEVLITSKYGSVDKTTFYTDCGNYFENYEDYDEVIAWQPLPQPYKESE